MSQFGVAVWAMSLPCCQATHNIAQGREGLVDPLGLLQGIPLSTRLAYALGTSKVHQRELGVCDISRCLVGEGDVEPQDEVGPRTVGVHVGCLQSMANPMRVRGSTALLHYYGEGDGGIMRVRGSTARAEAVAGVRAGLRAEVGPGLVY